MPPGCLEHRTPAFRRLLQPPTPLKQLSSLAFRPVEQVFQNPFRRLHQTAWHGGHPEAFPALGSDLLDVCCRLCWMQGRRRRAQHHRPPRAGGFCGTGLAARHQNFREVRAEVGRFHTDEQLTGFSPDSQRSATPVNSDRTKSRPRPVLAEASARSSSSGTSTMERWTCRVNAMTAVAANVHQRACDRAIQAKIRVTMTSTAVSPTRQSSSRQSSRRQCVTKYDAK